MCSGPHAQERFNFYSQFGAGENRLSAQGSRATTMDLTEFSRYLASAQLLYKHVSITQASNIFTEVCSANAMCLAEFSLNLAATLLLNKLASSDEAALTF